jgi:hypothetical protein
MQANSKGGKAISMGWSPESGFIQRNWDGYNEGMALYLLALGSRSHRVKDGAFEAWTAPFPTYWRGFVSLGNSSRLPGQAIQHFPE